MQHKIIEYELNEPIKQNGVLVAANIKARVLVPSGAIRSNQNDTGFDLYATVQTYKDDTHSELLDNDDFPFNNYIPDIGAVLPPNTIEEITEVEMSAYLTALGYTFTINPV